jgi:hypothetical protein
MVDDRLLKKVAKLLDDYTLAGLLEATAVVANAKADALTAHKSTYAADFWKGSAGHIATALHNITKGNG